MPQELVEIAPNYALTSRVSQTIHGAMDPSIFTYRTTGMATDMPTLQPSDELLQHLNYLLYPTNIQGQTAAVQSPQELFNNLIADLPARQQILHPYYPKDTLGKIQTIKQIQNKDMRHALATVMDYETVTMKDAFGNEKNWIYQATFQHIHSDATVGQFKKNQIQSFFIGIYDQEEIQYLDRIAGKVKKGGIKSLSDDEKVAYEYLSHLGASINKADDLLADNAGELIRLKEGTKSSFASLNNFTRAKEGLVKLGDMQRAGAEDGIPKGVQSLLDNLVEIVANDHSIATGWNVSYDINRSLEIADKFPGAEQYFKKKISALGLNPDNYSLSQLREREFDPYRNIINQVSGSARREWMRGTYGTNSRDIESGMHALQFEPIAKAQFKLHPEKSIYGEMHHNSLVDVLQESAYIFDPDSPMNPLYDEIENIVSQQSPGQPANMKGLLFQAQDSGAMQSLRKYNKNVFATVTASNGDIYASNGWKYDTKLKQWIQGDEFIPGAWAEGITYELTGIEYIQQGSKIAQGLAYGTPELAGTDFVKLNMRVGLLNQSQKLTEAGQEIHSIYMPKNMVESELMKHFRIIGNVDDDGNIMLNRFGFEQAAYINKKVGGRRVDYQHDPWKAYQDINDMRFLDRAERSFTKRSINTNENAILLRDILEEGSFAGTKRSLQLQQAVLAASKGDTTALDAILKGTTIKQSAKEITDLFTIDKTFNSAWFANTFTIANTMQKGSLFEQLHRSAIDIINDPKFYTTISANAHYNKNEMYRHIMEAGTSAIMRSIPEDKLKSLPGWMGRSIDDTKSYWINAGDFIRKFADPYEVLSEAEQKRRNWIRIDFTNPYTTATEIGRAAGLSGAQLKNDESRRRSLLSFINYLSDSDSRIDADARKEIKNIISNGTGNKSDFELATELGAIFEGLKGRQRQYGWAPEEVLLEHNSFLTTLSFKEGAIQNFDPVQRAMKEAAEAASKMLMDWKHRRGEVYNRLVKFMDQVNPSDYTKTVSRYNRNMQLATQSVLAENQKAIGVYANNLIDMLEKSGISLSVGKDTVYASYGRRTFDISGFLPKLKANAVGVQFWEMGDKGTRYIAAPSLELKNMHLHLGSMLNFAQGGLWNSSRAGTLLRNAVVTDTEPMKTFEWLLRRPLETLREDSLKKGASASDIRKNIYARFDPISHSKSSIEAIVRAGKNNAALDDAQRGAIDTLEKYLASWKTDRPVFGLAQQEALWTLIQSDNPMISPVIHTDLAMGSEQLRLTSAAKQTGSDTSFGAIAVPDTVRDYQDDAGKMLQNQLDNSLYFKTELGAQERRILKDGGLEAPIFGSMFGTETEAAISTFTENGVRTSNRFMTNIVDANDQVKNDIYQMLINKYKNDKTIADVFGATFMPYEGGGLMSSRLWDILQPSNTWKKMRGGIESIFVPANRQSEFENGLRFVFEGNRFNGYGPGVHLKKGDYAWRTYNKFFGDVRGQNPLSDNAILSEVYMTREGSQIVDADTLRKEVEQSFLNKNITNWTQEDFIKEADSLYDRYLVARNIYDTGVLKLGFDSEKHESVNAVRSINKLYSGDGLEDWQREEKLLRDIFYSDEFDTVTKRLGTDFREGKSLVADLYYDIADLKMQSPLFTEAEANAARKMIRNKVGAFYGLSDEDAIGKTFYRIMDQARHRLSDDLKELTGGTLFGDSYRLMAKHGNTDIILRSTAEWLRQQMEKNHTTTQNANEQVKKDLQRAYAMILDTGAITDRSGRAFTYKIDPDTGGVILKNADDINAAGGNFYLDPEKLKEVFRFNGSTFDTTLNTEEINLRFNKVLSPYVGTHMGEVSVLIDPVFSEQQYKITDRELASYTNTLWSEEDLQRIRQNMNDEAQFKSVFGKYIDESGHLKKEYAGKSVWGETLDEFFHGTAFARYKGDAEIGSMILEGNKVFNEAQTYQWDPYRSAKTKELVAGLKTEKGRVVSQRYADDLFQVASMQQATRYNRGQIDAIGLLSDNGKVAIDKIDKEGFFKNVSISQIETSRTTPSSRLINKEFSIFDRNLLIDVTDAEHGLTASIVGTNKIAIGGLNLSAEDDITAAKFQSKLGTLKEKYNQLIQLDQNSKEFSEELTDYRNLIRDIIQGQADYSTGNKIKTSKAAGLYGARAPGSINRKVNVESLEDSRLKDFLKDKTYNGQNLADMHKRGLMPNVAFISAEDLKSFGYTDEYFKKLGINYDDWLKRAKTEGISGISHRWPSDYWGSSMAVQIYIDPNATQGRIVYDEITAAFLKADSDGDWGQLMIQGASLQNIGNGKDTIYVDSLSAQLAKNLTGEQVNIVQTLQQEHAAKMAWQIHDTNKMVARNRDYHRIIDTTFEQYRENVLTGKTNEINAFIEKNTRVSLSGRFRPNDFDIRPENREQIASTFMQYKTKIDAAVDNAVKGIDIQDESWKWLRDFRSASNAAEAAGALQAGIAKQADIRQQIYKNLGNEAEEIDRAFEQAASLMESRKIALQRIARKGVGLSDTPFTSMEFLRMNALAVENSGLTNAQNTAMEMVKELTKEELLTPKQMNLNNVFNLTEDLNTLNELVSEVMQHGKNNDALEERFVSFIKNRARDPNTRYNPESMLAEFVTEKGGKKSIDIEKVAHSFYQGMVTSSEVLRQNTAVFNIINDTVMDTSRAIKGRISGLHLASQTLHAQVDNAIANSNGLDDAWRATGQLMRDSVEVNRFKNHTANAGKNILQHVVQDFRPGKSLAVAAVGLAAASVFGGYTGGNPAQPAQQQAQQIYEQNPPPRAINMADPSLTASNRKQAGYVININAQTERDKEYASRLITQAVTKNFQDTNINVSMNVNQQPGNISGNDLMDYLTQALN